jgi:hypothetical protein
MEELIKLVASKNNLSEDIAKKVVETVMGYLKDKLPAPVAGQIEGLLSGAVTADAGGLMDKLGGLLGKK